MSGQMCSVSIWCQRVFQHYRILLNYLKTMASFFKFANKKYYTKILKIFKKQLTKVHFSNIFMIIHRCRGNSENMVQIHSEPITVTDRCQAGPQPDRCLVIVSIRGDYGGGFLHRKGSL